MSRGKRVFVIGLLAVATVPVVYVITRPSTGELLTQERLEEARARWKERGLRSYVLDVDVRGARHHIEVRDGIVVTMTTDGNPVRAEAREYWSVDGMFRFLSEELSNREHPDAAFGVSDPSEVVLRAGFDPGNGFPARFLRHVQGQAKSLEWKATLVPR